MQISWTLSAPAAQHCVGTILFSDDFNTFSEQIDQLGSTYIVFYTRLLVQISNPKMLAENLWGWFVGWGWRLCPSALRRWIRSFLSFEHSFVLTIGNLFCHHFINRNLQPTHSCFTCDRPYVHILINRRVVDSVFRLDPCLDSTSKFTSPYETVNFVSSRSSGIRKWYYIVSTYFYTNC